MFRLVFVFFYLVLTCGCCSMDKFDCGGFSGFSLKIFSKKDSLNYFFCSPNRIPFSSVLFYSKKQNSIDTIVPSLSRDEYTVNFICDSIINLNYSQTSPKIYMSINSQTQDSFEIEYQQITQKCCGSYNKVVSVKHNGVVLNHDRTFNYYFFR